MKAVDLEDYINTVAENQLKVEKKFERLLSLFGELQDQVERLADLVLEHHACVEDEPTKKGPVN